MEFGPLCAKSGTLLLIRRRRRPWMVWRDDLRDASDEIPNCDRVGVGIDHDNHRSFLRGKVVGVRLVARDISVVAYPAELVLDTKPI